jgi:hypothetical protein
MKTRIVVIFCISLLTISCTKHDSDQNSNDNQQNQIIYSYDTIIAPYLLQNFLFNKGTYWIYRDSITGVTDSCVVDSVMTGYQVYLIPHGYQGILANNIESIIKYVFNKRTGNFPGAYIILNDGIQKYLQYPGTQYFDYYIGRFEDFNDTFYLDNNDTLFQNYSIDTTIYSEVYKFYYQNPWHIYSPEDWGYYYMKAGIGIIKSEYYINGQRSVYELVRYHIN